MTNNANPNPNPFMGAPAPGAAPMPTGQAPVPTQAGAAIADTFEVDLTNVQSGFCIPNGFYRVRCIEVEQGVSQAGNPQYIWTFTIVDQCPAAGRDFKVFTALTPAALWKVAETVIALGVGQTGQVVKFSRSDVLNKECGAIIEDSEYNGTVRSQISKVISLEELAKARA